MRLPIGWLAARDLELFDAQGAVAKGTDPLGLWTAEYDHISPGTSRDRHDEVPQTGATAAALIADDDNQQGSSDQPDTKGGEGEEHVVQKERRRRPKLFQKLGRLGVVSHQDELKAQNYRSA